MIGERLQMVRKHYRVRQAELANILGVSKFTVQSWEQAKSNPSYETLAKICQMYHVSSNFLLGLTDQLPTYQEDSSVPLFQGLNEESQGMLKSYADFLRVQQKSSGESISK